MNSLKAQLLDQLNNTLIEKYPEISSKVEDFDTLTYQGDSFVGAFKFDGKQMQVSFNDSDSGLVISDDLKEVEAKQDDSEITDTEATLQEAGDNVEEEKAEPDLATLVADLEARIARLEKKFEQDVQDEPTPVAESKKDEEKAPQEKEAKEPMFMVEGIVYSKSQALDFFDPAFLEDKEIK